MVAMDGRDPWSWRRVRDRGAHRRMHKENISPKSLAENMRGVEFHKFLQSVGLKDWSFKSQLAWLGNSPVGTVVLLERRKANNPGADIMETVI